MGVPGGKKDVPSGNRSRNRGLVTGPCFFPFQSAGGLNWSGFSFGNMCRKTVAWISVIARLLCFEWGWLGWSKAGTEEVCSKKRRFDDCFQTLLE